MITSRFQQALIFGGLFATTVTLNAFAFDLQQIQPGEPPYHQAFVALDKDASQTLSAQELKADDSLNHSRWQAFDTNHDGVLNADEYGRLKTQVSEQSIKQTLSDSWITAKVKTVLLEEAALKSLDISVETHDGQVLLSGFVKDPVLKTKAEVLVSAVEGVRAVRNAIQISS